MTIKNLFRSFASFAGVLCAVLMLSVFLSPAFVTGCKTAADQRVVAVQTLKAVGQSAEAAVSLSAQLYRDGRITGVQARQVMDFYDLKFQPTFKVAVAASQSDLSTIASPDVIALATQLSQLVLAFQQPPGPSR